VNTFISDILSISVPEHVVPEKVSTVIFNLAERAPYSTLCEIEECLYKVDDHLSEVIEKLQRIQATLNEEQRWLEDFMCEPDDDEQGQIAYDEEWGPPLSEHEAYAHSGLYISAADY